MSVSYQLSKRFLIGVKKKKNNLNIHLLRTRGGGVKKMYRNVDFYFIFGVILPYLFLGYLRDPRRTAFLGIYVYFNGILNLRIASDSEKVFDLYDPLDLEENLVKTIGKITTLNFIRGGSSIHNLPFYFSGVSKMIRSAGLFAQLLRNDFLKGLSYIRIRRGFDVILPLNTRIILGRVCNKMHYEFKKGKAGVFRRIGLRPIVRGIAMNPVDHPNGGRTPGGKVYRSFSNKIARSFLRTSTKKQRSNKYIYLFKNLEV